jgi:hypothetical protein
MTRDYGKSALNIIRTALGKSILQWQFLSKQIIKQLVLKGVGDDQ